MNKNISCKNVNKKTWLRFCQLSKNSGVNNGALLSAILEHAFKNLTKIKLLKGARC